QRPGEPVRHGRPARRRGRPDPVADLPPPEAAGRGGRLSGHRVRPGPAVLARLPAPRRAADAPDRRAADRAAGSRATGGSLRRAAAPAAAPPPSPPPLTVPGTSLRRSWPSGHLTDHRRTAP